MSMVRAAGKAYAIGAIPTIRDAHVVHWILRLAVAAEFVGHGAFGILTKAAWVPYFGVVGIPEGLAWRLMPVIGAVDIALGLLALVRPMPAVLLYMAIWGFWTALLRPLTGEGLWELFERAGNFGVPLAFLYLSRPGPRLGDWFAEIDARTSTHGLEVRLAWILRVTTAALLIGHGGFGAFMHKASWVGYFGAAGITPEMVEAASMVTRLGWFEIALGLLVLACPLPGVLLFAFAWKVGTESLRPVVGEPFWEVIERGASYAAPLALLYVQQWAGVTPPERTNQVEHLVSPSVGRAGRYPVVAGRPGSGAAGPVLRPPAARRLDAGDEDALLTSPAGAPGCPRGPVLTCVPRDRRSPSILIPPPPMSAPSGGPTRRHGGIKIPPPPIPAPTGAPTRAGTP